jgi:hypothetical protein
MVLVLKHFGRSPKKQSRQRNRFEMVSLTRLFFEPAAQGDAYIAHGLEAHATGKNRDIHWLGQKINCRAIHPPKKNPAASRMFNDISAPVRG